MRNFAYELIVQHYIVDDVPARVGGSGAIPIIAGEQNQREILKDLAGGRNRECLGRIRRVKRNSKPAVAIW